MNAGDVEKITPADLKAKMASIQSDMSEQVEDKRNQLVMAGGALLLIVVLLAFFFGFRGGRKSSTVVEIHRS